MGKRGIHGQVGGLALVGLGLGLPLTGLTGLGLAAAQSKGWEGALWSAPSLITSP
jgi:hypothetical protein